MLPGVELARRRRVHYHGDVASSSAGAAEHHYYAHAHHAAPAPTGVAGPALAARIRLEEKLRGAALPPTSPSRSVALPLPLSSASSPVLHIRTPPLGRRENLLKRWGRKNLSDYRKMKRLDKSSIRYRIALLITAP